MFEGSLTGCPHGRVQACVIIWMWLGPVICSPGYWVYGVVFFGGWGGKSFLAFYGIICFSEVPVGRGGGMGACLQISVRGVFGCNECLIVVPLGVLH